MKTLFAIFGAAKPSALSSAIERQFPGEFIEVGSGQWFVVASGTAKDVSDRLGISAGTVGSGIVVASSGYFGRAPSNVWEWIAAKVGAKSV